MGVMIRNFKTHLGLLICYTQMGLKSRGIFMISQLFDNATKKAGNQTALAEILGLTQQRLSAFKNYKTGGKRKPNDETIIRLAEYMGLDKADTLYQAKLELEPENAHLWEFLNGVPGGN